jgi:hypothetical protein
MKRYLLDSGVASLYYSRRRGVVEWAKSETKKRNRVGIGTPIIAELLLGLEGSSSREENLRRFSPFFQMI